MSKIIIKREETCFSPIEVRKTDGDLLGIISPKTKMDEEYIAKIYSWAIQGGSVEEFLKSFTDGNEEPQEGGFIG